MSIDWSKYGVEKVKEDKHQVKTKTNTEIDFSKYDNTSPNSIHAQEQKQYVDQMKAAYKSNPDSFNVKPVTTPIPAKKKEPVWNGVKDNPITNTAKKALNVAGEAYDAVSHLPVINQATGFLQGAVEPFVHTTEAEKNMPIWEKYLGNVKDAYNLTKVVTNPASMVGMAFPKNKSLKDIGNSFLEAPVSAVKGAIKPDEARKNLSDSLKSKSLVTQLAVGSAADPLSYVPIPSIKGIKSASSAISKTFDNLFGRVEPIESAPIAHTGPVLGLPEPKSAILAREAQNRSVLSPNTNVIHGQGDVQTLGLPESQQYNAIQRIKAQQTLGLPEANPQTVADFNRRNGNVQPTNTNPIYGQGNVADPLGLPQGNYVKPTRLKVNDANQSLDYVMNQIKPEVMDIIQAPARRDLLVNYVQKNTGYPVNEIHNMPMKDLQDLGQQIQDKLHGNMQQIAYDVAAKHGHDLPSLLEGQAPSLRGQMAKDAQSRVYGVPAEKVNIAKPQFNKEVTGQAAAPRQGLSFKREPKLSDAKASGETLQQMQQRYEKQIQEANDRQRISELSKPIIGRSAMPETKIKRLSEMRQEVAAAKAPVNGTVIKNNAVQQPRTTTVLSDTKVRGQQLKDLKTGDEMRFSQTVKSSDNTAPELIQKLNEQPQVGTRTTDVLNRQEATKMIEKHGTEVLYSKLMSKTKQFDSSETTAAQILAKHFSSLGGEANLTKAIDLVSKTAKGGREMGQAIQALSQWNKLDAEGALLLGERKLNQGIQDTKDWKSLTPAQGAPLTEAAQRIGQAQDTKSLADEVLNIVTNKQAGEALTEAEKATVKQFQDQVKLINEKGKGILSKPKVNKVNETIKNVSQIEPKARTRDQVVSFLDAKADLARKRLAASRNVGFAAINKGNPVIDYAIIGASHIAKGVVKLSDFTEAMVRDFGDSVKPHINEAFNRATNIFRKENGLPTVEQLDKAVNAAVKSEHFTTEEANQFKAWASEIGHYADKNLKVEATQDLQRALNEIGTSTLGDKLSSTQTAAQLLSVPTLVRNVVGNEAFNLVEKINKMAAAPIDWGLSKFTGERTVVFSAKNQEKYWTNFVKGLKGGWKGVSPNGQFEAYDIHPNAFKGDKNPLKYMQKALGAELQSFDHAAYMRAYGRTLGEYAKITGKKVEELDQAIFDLADEAGRYATFQDDTFLSKLATGTKRLLNKPTDLLADALVHKGVLPESLSWKGFGTGDLILKYAKTPANIVMRGIDYSPIGLLRGVGELLPLITKKEFNQRAATMALSRGITGTLGMTGLGYALISAGVLTGKSSSDADIRSLDTMTGKGEYKVNWSALSRYVTGGFDKEAAQWQKGDNIFDWGWLQPMAISISMGVNAQQSVEKQKSEGVSSYVGVAKDALVGSLKTIMQQPLLSGVQNLVSGVTNVMRYGSWTGIANIFKGLPASFVPSAVNQTRNFTDNTSRNTYDPSALKEALNMVINKIPGLDKKLPIAYDTLGNKREQVQDGQDKTAVQGAKTFLSPIKMTDYTVSPEAKMIIDLINATGDEKVAPRTPNKYLMVNKKKIELTPDQYSEIQQKTGEATQQALAKISTYLSSDIHTDDQKVKKVIDALNKVGDSVRTQLNKEYPELKPKTPAQLRGAR
jgi:hypothetical protein